MANRPPASLATALYPNLKSGMPDLVEQRAQPQLADAMYRPQSRSPTYSELKDAWRDHVMKLSGIRKKAARK